MPFQKGHKFGKRFQKGIERNREVVHDLADYFLYYANQYDVIGETDPDNAERFIFFMLTKGTTFTPL